MQNRNGLGFRVMNGLPQIIGTNQTKLFMSIQVSGINLPNAIIDCEYRVTVLESLFDKIIPNLPPDTITTAVLDKARADAMSALQKKYPDAGIRRI